MASANIETKEHAHGLGAIPISRADVRGSFDVADFPVPNGREEEWRFTPLRRLKGLHDTADKVGPGTVTVEVSGPDSIAVETVGRDDERLGTSFLPSDRVSARAYSSFEQATVITVPPEVQGETLTVNVTGTSFGMGYGHTVVRVERNATVTVVLDYSGSAVYADNTEFIIEDGARLNVVSLQDWADDGVHVTQQHAQVGRDATFRSFVATLGGDLVRVVPKVRYSGPGGDAELYGLYFTGAGQQHEHHSLVDHSTSHTRSRVDYRGVLSGDDARAVWIGDVIIGENTEGTDSYENNRNLQLTENTRVDSVPNLEIFTGEVAGAGHASASGRLDEIHLFYLMSRGIPSDEARRLVIRGYFEELINRIEDTVLRERVSAEVEEKLQEQGLG